MVWHAVARRGLTWSRVWFGVGRTRLGRLGSCLVGLGWIELGLDWLGWLGWVESG